MVNFTHTFGLSQVKDLRRDAERADYTSLQIKQYGRFRDEDVMSILGTHGLSILYSLYGFHESWLTLEEVVVSVKPDCSQPTSVSTLWKREKGQSVHMFVSLEDPSLKKTREITFYDSKAYCYGSFCFEQPNNLNRMIEVALQGESNYKTILRVAKCLTQYQQFENKAVL